MPADTTLGNEPLALKIGGGRTLVPLDVAGAEDRMHDLRRLAEVAGADRLVRFLESGAPAEIARLGAVLDLSPYLRETMLARPQWLERLFDIDACDRVREIVAGIEALPEAGAGESRLMTALREAKREASLLIALRDLFGAADGRTTTADLSDLAEAAIRAALRFGLLDLHTRGKLALGDLDDPERGCGLFVLGMGKLGGRELNYSSDIDLIVFFDPDCAAIADPDTGVETFSRLVKRLVRILAERTRDGYVFRTDLRLRPDPGAMPLAIPVPAAIGYYEGSGRNWERAALIKARCVAGDVDAAEAFLDEITPFVWRKYLDFAAIAEIEAMKDRIDRHRGFDRIAVGGHNVKLGPGGIREIEFFAQTQQLIAGGRNPALRLRRTEETLSALAGGGWISGEVADELTEVYWFLRSVEHVIQMIADEQRHTLPEDEAGLLRVARLAGFPSVDGFAEALRLRLTLVERRFSGLFSGRGKTGEGTEPSVGLLLDGEDEAAAIAELDRRGFKRPLDVLRMVRGWGSGRYRATRAEGARRNLARVLPELIAAFSGARDPDAAVAAFDGFLARLPAGLQFFAIIASNPKILDLLALILTSAPRLAETIAHRPHVFDALLDPAFYREAPTASLMRSRLGAFLADADDYEDRLVRLRIFASEQQFLVGAGLLSGAMEGEAAGGAYSAIADIAIEAALAAVETEFVRRHGRVRGGRLVLFGLGRLGSRELTAGSDVDLILLYDHDLDADESDGPTPLAATVYYARLTQRLIAALTAPMGEGVLYEVDFRLRPSGNKGPLATHIDAFRRYQRSEARTWERMALTRSRPLAGDGELGRTVRDIICEAIEANRHEPETISADVASMRARIERDKPARGALDLKLRAGGLIDLEFIAQWAILAGRVPLAMIGRPTVEVLAMVESSESLTNRNPPVTLRSSMQLYTRVVQLTRLGPGGVHGVDRLPQGLAERVAKACGLEAAAVIEPSVDEAAAAVRQAFDRLLPHIPSEGG